ncbi:MAG: primosomal protein N' [Candidatus Aminicenantes bacterium]|nr:primosomal protein N' [Candidatus Aminicenantes bacterium]
MSLFASVALPVPLRKTFLYVVPEKYHHEIQRGTRVLVPFRKQILTGYVTEITKKAPSKDMELKDIQELLDREPVFSSSFLDFTKQLSDHYYSFWGEILRASLPPSLTLKTQVRIHITEKGKNNLDKDAGRGLERKLLQFLSQRPYTETYLRRKFKRQGFSTVISKLIEKGWIQKKRELKKPPQRKCSVPERVPSQLEMDYSLDRESKKIADKVRTHIGTKRPCLFLIQAPKKNRESIYLSLIKKASAAGFKTLLLVPEIQWTEKILKHLENKLGEKAAFLHSRLSEKQRELTWKRIKKGEADVVVGPRSALLSPAENVGLIVLDEEHDDSYYQKESPAYDARIGALLRAEQEKAVLVYGSDKPTVEGLHKAQKEKTAFELATKAKVRFNKRLIDSRKQSGVLSSVMRTGIQKRMEKKESVLLFFNRHGYASSLVCSGCGFAPKCRNCDVLLTYYKKENKLYCRYCTHSPDFSIECPDCGSRMVPGGGFGIEVLEEELRKNFPDSCIKSLHRFSVKNRKEQEKIVNDFQKGQIDILIGTQMLAHQSKLTPSSLVGVFFPESLLRLADFRGSYKAYRYLRQTMTFVQNNRDSEFMVQTYLPKSYPIQDAVFEDSSVFYKHELRNRQLMDYPPFAYLAEVLFSGKDLRTVAKKSRKLLDILEEDRNHIEILGPSLAPLKKLRGRNRVQVIIKAKNRNSLDRALKRIFEDIKTRKSVFIYE